jgi:hypothetical protein
MYRTSESPPADQNIGLSQSADWRERLGGVVVICMLLLGALALVLHGLQKSKLTCDASGQCKVAGATTANFSRDSIRDVRVVSAGSKTNNYYLIVELANVPHLQITPALSFDAATSARTQLAAFSRPQASTVGIQTVASQTVAIQFAPSCGLVVFGVVVAVLAVFLAVLLVRGRAYSSAVRTVFRVSASKLQLSVYAGGKSQHFSLPDIVEIRVVFNTSPQPGVHYGLDLVLLSGAKSELAPLRPGPKPVLQAAAALRHALMLPAVDDVTLLTARLGGRLSWAELLRSSAGTVGSMLALATAVVGGTLAIFHKFARQVPTPSSPIVLICALTGAVLALIVPAAVLMTARRSARLPPW